MPVEGLGRSLNASYSVGVRARFGLYSLIGFSAIFFIQFLRQIYWIKSPDTDGKAQVNWSFTMTYMNSIGYLFFWHSLIYCGHLKYFFLIQSL